MSSVSLQILMVLADSVPISTNQSYLHVRSENQHQSNTYHMRADTNINVLNRGKGPSLFQIFSCSFLNLVFSLITSAEVRFAFSGNYLKSCDGKF